MSEGALDLGGRLALTVAEAASALGVSERHLRTLLTEIPHVYVGNRVVIPVEPLRDWLREQAVVERDRTDEAADRVLEALSSK